MRWTNFPVGFIIKKRKRVMKIISVKNINNQSILKE